MKKHAPSFLNAQAVRVYQPVHKTWYLKFNDPSTQRALWLRFTVLKSRNGFKRTAETWGVFFQKGNGQDIKKIAIKQAYPVDAFSSSGDEIKIGNCHFTPTRTHGMISSKGNSIEWDLNLIPDQHFQFPMIPEILAKTGLIKNSITTQNENLLVSGVIKVNGESISWKEAPGSWGEMHGPRIGHSWIWSQCNTFVDEQNKSAPFIFEGLSVRIRLGPLITPRLSSFFFRYQKKSFYFNSLRDIFRLKSNSGLNEWRFQADRGELSFRGYARAEHKDFAGLTFEDTNGSLLYCANSKLSDMNIHVYRKGKLEATFVSEGTAALEVVSREKNPYVPLLI